MVGKLLLECIRMMCTCSFKQTNSLFNTEILYPFQDKSRWECAIIWRNDTKIQCKITDVMQLCICFHVKGLYEITLLLVFEDFISFKISKWTKTLICWFSCFVGVFLINCYYDHFVDLIIIASRHACLFWQKVHYVSVAKPQNWLNCWIVFLHFDASDLLFHHPFL